MGSWLPLVAVFISLFYFFVFFFLLFVGPKEIHEGVGNWLALPQMSYYCIYTPKASFSFLLYSIRELASFSLTFWSADYLVYGMPVPGSRYWAVPGKSFGLLV